MEKMNREKLAAKSDGCRVHRVSNETGKGTITIYDVFPGVVLTYNEFHIGSWLLQYRMNCAAELLISDREISIARLDGAFGYDSPSKFAIAFRRVMGMSPTEYRNKKIT